MSKMLNIFLLTLIVLLVLRFSGILVSGTTMLGTLDLTNPSNFEGTELWGIIAKVGALVIASATAAALLGASLDVIIFAGLTAGLASTIINMLLDLMTISQQLFSISPALSALIVSPLLLMGIFGVIDWYRGKD